MESLVPDAEPLLSVVVELPELSVSPFESGMLHAVHDKLASSVACRSWALRSPLKNHLGVF